VIIRPTDRGPALVNHDGVLVHHGPQTTDLDIAAFMRRERESQARNVRRSQG
jgi:hypothetical protein